MSLLNSIRNTIVPVHKEGYPFVAGFFVASLVLGWVFEPLFWVGLILTLWCAYFFRDPERMTPQDDDLVIMPADGRSPRVADGDAAGRARSRPRADAAHLDLHERLQLPCEPLADARPHHQYRLSPRQASSMRN